MESGILPVIGMSPGNSYFDDANTRFVLSAVFKKYGKAVVLIPDIPAISTYEALGYEGSKARAKAVLKGNNLKNRVRRIAAELHLGELQIPDWKDDVENDPGFLRSYAVVKDLYDGNSAFRKAARLTTADVLIKSDRDQKVSEEGISHAVTYLLSEIAFMEWAPSHFEASRVIYVYHRSWPVFEEYVSGKFDNKEKKTLGFEVIAHDR